MNHLENTKTALRYWLTIPRIGDQSTKKAHRIPRKYEGRYTLSLKSKDDI